jgi:hypothetical protein
MRIFEWQAKGGKGPAKPVDSDEEEDDEELSANVAGLNMGAGGAPAPFSFAPAPKGSTPAAPGSFSFAPAGTVGAGGAGGNFTFNFSANNPGGGQGGDDEQEDDEDDVDHVEEFIKSLPEPVQACVKELNAYDDEVSELEKQFRKELRDLERKYEALMSPVYGKRCEVVTGKRVEFAEGKGDGTGVPDFWLSAMNNCMVVATNITEKDEVRSIPRLVLCSACLKVLLLSTHAAFFNGQI